MNPADNSSHIPASSSAHRSYRLRRAGQITAVTAMVAAVFYIGDRSIASGYIGERLQHQRASVQASASGFIGRLFGSAAASSPAASHVVPQPASVATPTGASRPLQTWWNSEPAETTTIAENENHAGTLPHARADTSSGSVDEAFRYVGLTGLLLPARIDAPISTGWRGTMLSGGFANWSDSSNWDNGAPGGNVRNLFFGQAWHNAGRPAGGTTSRNDIVGYSGHRIFFEQITGGDQQTFTLTGNALTLFDFDNDTPAIINQSSVNQNVNFGGTGVTFNPGTTNASLIQVNGGAGGNLTFGAPIVLGGTTNQLRISGTNANTVTFNGVISATAGTHSVVTSQGGSNITVVYAAANTYSGDTFIDSGTLQFGTAASATGSANNSILRLGQNAANSPAAAINLATTAGGQNISSMLVVRPSSSGTQGIRTLSSSNTSGTNTWSGNIFLDAGLTITQANGGTFAFTGTTFDIKGQTLTFSGVNAAMGNPTGLINIGANIINSTGTGSVQIGGTINNNLNGVIVTLSGNNSYSGTTTVRTNSILNLGSATALGNSPGITFAGNGSFDNTTGAALTLNKGLTLSGGSPTFIGTSNLTLGGAVAISGSNRSITVNANTLTLNGNMTEDASSRSFTKNGAGTLALGGTNNFSGGLLINAGTLSVNADAALGAVPGAAATNNIRIVGATLAFSESATINANRGIGIGAVDGSSASSATIDVASDKTVTYGGAIASAGTTGATSLTKSNAGTLTLSGANTYTGTTTVNGGTLALDSAGSTTARLVNTSGITVNNGGTLRLGNSTGTASTDRINNGANITLDGGTFNTGGFSEGSAVTGGAGVGALTLTATSTIDFGTSGNSILHFAGLGTHTAGTILQITNWAGNFAAGGSGDRLLFSGSTTDFTTRYTQSEVSFNGLSGYNIYTFDGFYEVTAIPEPSTYIAGALTLLALGWTQLRKRRRASGGG